MDYLILMSEKYLHFRSRKRHVARKFFSHPVEVTGFMYLTNIFELCISQRYKQKLERIWNNSLCIKVDNFPKSANFYASQKSKKI